MNLVLHIGLPKTGTTTIQRRIRHCPSYSGRHSSSLKNICRTRQGARWFRSAERWAKNLYNLRYRRDLLHDAMLLSSEAMFVAHPAVYRLKWPVFVRGLHYDTVQTLREPSTSEYLKALQAVWPHGQIKVLLTLRNQPDWLSSLYAQMSNRINSASQRDFESEIQDLIQRGDDYIDWSSWVDKIQNVIGESNLKVLLLEDMHHTTYWEELVQFTDLGTCIDPEQIAQKQSPPSNVRRIKNLTWRLRPLVRPTPNINEAYIALRELQEPNLGLYIKGMLTQAYRGVIDAVPYLQQLSPSGRTEEITMHPELRAQIRSYCHPFNRRLAAQLQRDDLQELGY